MIIQAISWGALPKNHGIYPYMVQLGDIGMFWWVQLRAIIGCEGFKHAVVLRLLCLAMFGSLRMSTPGNEYIYSRSWDANVDGSFSIS